MEQSIAQSQGNAGPGRRSLGYWMAVLAGTWSRITTRSLKFTPGARQSAYTSGSEIAAILDIDNIAARLGIENRAKSDGMNEQPPATEEVMSGTQKEIVVYFQELQRKGQHRIAVMAEKLRELRQEIDTSGVKTRLQDIPSRIENRILRLIAESQSTLDFLTQPQQHDKDSREHKPVDQNGDEADSPVLHWIFTVVLMGAGAIAISKISVPGYGSEEIVPPVWAVLISFVVVLVSSFIANGMSRAARQVGQMMRLLGTAAGIGCVWVTASFAAHYVARLTANATVTVQQAVHSILADPIAITTNVADWKVFGIVITAGLLAYLVNYKPEASHPVRRKSPGTIHWMHRKRNRLTKRLRKQINAIIDDADSEATELPTQLKLKLRHYSSLVDESKRYAASLTDFDISLEDSCNIILDRYRAANTITRQSDVPASFSEHICFRSDHEANVALLDREEARLAELGQEIIEIETEAARVRQSLRDLNAQAISALEEKPASAS
jgi:hypothetical protein